MVYDFVTVCCGGSLCFVFRVSELAGAYHRNLQIKEGRRLLTETEMTASENCLPAWV